MQKNKNKVDLKLNWCSHKAAKYAVENWHYSKRMPVGKLVKIGVWENGNFIGVVIYGMGNNLHIGDFLGLEKSQICELVRVALTEHKSEVTKIVSISLKLLKKQSPGLRAVISYADPEEGHVGGIYKGGNWFYVGKSTASIVYLINGEEIHSRVARPGKSIFGRKPKQIKGIENAKEIRKMPKYKYVYPLDKEARNKIEPLAKPYPKRPCAGSIDNDASGYQSEEGGANPTSALH